MRLPSARTLAATSGVIDPGGGTNGSAGTSTIIAVIWL